MLLALSVGLSGCSDSSSGSSGGGPTDGDGPGSGNATLTSSMSGAVRLEAMDETVVESSGPARVTAAGRSLFTYEVHNQGLTEAAAASLRGQPKVRAAEDETAGTNLLAIDEDGNATLALESNYPIKVMYSVADPNGEYVYLALDTGWWNWDGNDYSQFIAQAGCAFFRVEIDTDEIACVEEGLFVQNMDDNYFKAVSGNQKPIQFDADGNVYFTGTTFTQECDDWGCWLNQTDWNPRIYRVSSEDGAVTALTQDNAWIDYFLTLSTGELVYQSLNEDTWESNLYVWQDGQTIDLTTQGWGVNFFTGDTNNSVLWGDWGSAGVRVARPLPGGGVHYSALDTTLFGDNSYSSTTPLRILVGDDGRLYGVFEAWHSECADYGDGACNDWNYYTVLSVYQMLPYDPVPKVELTLSDDWGWWHWMGRTPFQVSKGHLYYSETVDVEIDGASFGTADVIHVVRLEDRVRRTALDEGLSDSEGARYEIYSWRLSGDELHFSALDKSRTVVVTGVIDTTKVRAGADESEYLTLTDTSSASGATASIQDIEVLRPRQPDDDPGANPVVQEFHANPDNRYSVSVDFNKYMDMASVEESMEFVSTGDQEPVPGMKVWLYKTLHLIPDLDGLANATVKPLDHDTEYRLAFGEGTMDAYGWDLAAGTQGKETTWTTLPADGWYAAQADDASGDFADGQMARFLGRADKNSWTPETYDLEVDASDNVRIEFSARNYSWEGIEVVLWNGTSPDDNPWHNREAKVVFGSGWIDLDYKYVDGNGSNTWEWVSGLDDVVFNGNWGRYRIDFYGNSIRVSYSTDGTTFHEIDGLSVDDFRYENAGSDDYTLLLRVREPVSIDNLTVTSLDASGEVSGQDAVRMDEGFEDELPDGLNTNIEGEINKNDYWW